MQFSYWELKTWFSDIDFTIVGSGIVGLSTSLYLRQIYPKAKILVIERGTLPQGASTKNAGFACFGSLSEILSDLQLLGESRTLELIEKRVTGLEILRNNLGDKKIDFKQHGGYELFLDSENNDYQYYLDNIDKINQLLYPLFKENVFSAREDIFGFKGIKPLLIYNKFEGQLDTGMMMNALLKKVQSEGIFILNNIRLNGFKNQSRSVEVDTDIYNFKTKKLCITTNGFASQLLDIEVKPARAQVLITKPIDNLRIKGTFHIKEGYYYFRNIDNRILFGGGRELDFKSETTTEFGLTDKVQNRLETLLKETILPGTKFEIDHKWSGIMGVGPNKTTIVKQIEENIFCGVRLGGMGVAIGSLIGKELAALFEQKS